MFLKVISSAIFSVCLIGTLHANDISEGITAEVAGSQALSVSPTARLEVGERVKILNCQAGRCEIAFSGRGKQSSTGTVPQNRLAIVIKEDIAQVTNVAAERSFRLY